MGSVEARMLGAAQSALCLPMAQPSLSDSGGQDSLELVESGGLRASAPALLQALCGTALDVGMCPIEVPHWYKPWALPESVGHGWFVPTLAPCTHRLDNVTLHQKAALWGLLGDKVWEHKSQCHSG